VWVATVARTLKISNVIALPEKFAREYLEEVSEDRQRLAAHD